MRASGLYSGTVKNSVVFKLILLKIHKTENIAGKNYG
jgi:hypothetical protein